MVNGNGIDKSKFAQWSANGALATAGWVLVLIVYCTFRAFKIEDPILGQAFLLLTGLWVGNLTIAQGKKSAKVEETAERAEAKADALADRATSSERRETEPSLHEKHLDGDDAT